MNIAGLPDLVLSLLRGPSASPAQTQAAQTPPKFVAGAEYSGTVMDRLPNGRLLVDIAGQRMNMALPGNLQAGDTVRLTYVTNSARPTFVLRQEQAQPAQPVRLSSSAQQVGALMRLGSGGQGPVTGVGATGAALNSAVALATSDRPIATSTSMLTGQAGLATLPGVGLGRSTGLLGEAVNGLRASLSPSATLTANTTTELPAPSHDLLPVRLAKTVSESGLFYESHLAQWNRGERSLEAIQREPQAHLTGQPATQLAELGNMPARAAHLAASQLQLLEGNPFVWQGQAWPGQTVEWRVEERDAREQGEDGDEAYAWNTGLTMTLPHLGAVEAHLGLSGDRLSLKLAADSEAARNAMQAALPDLLAALQEAGLQPVRIEVTERVVQ